MTTPPALEVTSLEAGYGKDLVIFDINLTIEPGEIVTIIGHNGAGKTTLLRAAHGLIKPRSGAVRLFGTDVTKFSPSRRVASGMAFVPENHFVFPELTVAENLLVGAHHQSGARTQELIADVFELFPVLADRSRQRAGTMSGGERRILSIGTALMAEPRLLLLDEPSLGLAPVLVQQVMDTVARIARERSLSVVLVEQNVEQALRLAQRAYVIRAGRVVHTSRTEDMGSGADLLVYF